MEIWLVTVGEPVPLADPDNPRLLRTGILAHCLAQRGHAVTWWTSTFDHSRKKQRSVKDDVLEWNGVWIRMLRGVGYRRNVSLRRFVEHAIVAGKFRRAARGLARPDLVVASLPTLELARAAVSYGRRNGVPVLLDVRDLWPDAIHQLMPRFLRPISRTLLYGLRRSAITALRGCTGIVGISRGYLEWGLNQAKRPLGPCDGIFPLGYVAPLVEPARLAEAGDKLCRLGVDPGKIMCWYVGSFGRQYDLAPVLAVAATFAQKGREDVQFVISGDGDLGARWRALAEGLPNVVFTGWINGDEIAWLRSRASVGLQPYAVGAPQGLANKLFEYLSAGIPVLSSLAGENAQLISEFRCGLNYVAGDNASFARELARLLDDPQLRTEMGQRAAALFRQRFDSNAAVLALANHIEYVATRCHPAAT